MLLGLGVWFEFEFVFLVHRRMKLQICAKINRTLGWFFDFSFGMVLADNGVVFDCSWGFKGCQERPFFESWGTLGRPLSCLLYTSPSPRDRG